MENIPTDLPPEKELEILRDRLKKADADIKKAVMQGRILQKKAEEKSREDLKKAQKESDAMFQLEINNMTKELEDERARFKAYKENSDKLDNDKKLYESRYLTTESILKDQNKCMNDILIKVKSAQTAPNHKIILQEIMSMKLPQFPTSVDLLAPSESFVKYGVPLRRKPLPKPDGSTS